MPVKSSIEPGTVFSRLTVVGEAEPFVNCKTGYRSSASECECECGARVVVRNNSLRTKSTQSCGCLQRESAIASATHGHSRRSNQRTGEYNSWACMVSRVTNPKNPRWERYGGRGIVMCERWKSFENFIADMGQKPSPQHSIDRFPDRDGSYCPENCRWATDQEQRINCGDVRRFTFYGMTKTVREWSKITQVLAKTISNRLDAGWPERFAFWGPVGSKLAALKSRYPHLTPTTSEA